jgi:SSS family solute:Na+ symporter
MHTLDLIIIAVYLIGVTLFGCSFYFRKGQDNSDSFMSGGGRLPSWAIGLSIFATFVSSIAFLALPAKAYLTNWNAYVLSLTVPIASVAAAFFFVPLYRSLKCVSAYSYLETRFGLWARMYGSLCFLVMQSARSGMILYLLALPLQSVLGVPCSSIILVTGIATLFFSMMGGISAVIWTDAVQSVILIAGTLLCLIVLGCSMPDGLPHAMARAWQAGKFSLGSLSLTDWGTETFAVTFIYGTFINLQNFGIDQSFTQRYVSAKNMKDALKSMFLGSLLYIPVTLCFVLIGTGLWAYYTAQPGLLPADVAAKSDRVFPWFIVNGLPTGVSGLLVAAIVSAAVSTISTTLNSGATILLEDFYKRFKPARAADDKACLRFLRWANVGLAAFSIAVAFAVMDVKSALTAWWAMQSVLSGGMLGLFLLGYFCKKATSGQAMFATLVGILVVGLITFGQGKPPILHTNLAIVLGTISIFAFGWLASSARHPGR